MTSLASTAHRAEPVAATAPPPPLFEAVSCYMCGSVDREHFITAEDDLGGTPGITMVLHTWDQRLRAHFHVHCLITGGALSLDQRWRKARLDPRQTDVGG